MNNQSTTAGSNTSSTPKMQEQTQGAPVASTGGDNGKQALLKDIHVKWDKFSEQDARNLKSNDDLVTQLVSKYGLAKDVAQRDADTLRAGRNI